MSAPLDLAGPQRQQGLGAIEGLNLGLLVHTKTRACCGGSMYSPTMSRTLSTKYGSAESLKVSLRWGCREKACHIRWIVDGA